MPYREVFLTCLGAYLTGWIFCNGIMALRAWSLARRRAKIVERLVDVIVDVWTTIKQGE